MTQPDPTNQCRPRVRARANSTTWPPFTSDTSPPRRSSFATRRPRAHSDSCAPGGRTAARSGSGAETPLPTRRNRRDSHSAHRPRPHRRWCPSTRRR
ncbi:hypothetical protein KTR9_5103 (plasmid) [Gordonia sp. KTR9]|nr:hypothetical protein KTR9_5103 [Gordonia sp. KTR9]